jgi:WD40 repeat protein
MLSMQVSAAWLPDGNQLATLSIDGVLRIWRIDGL